MFLIVCNLLTGLFAFTVSLCVCVCLVVVVVGGGGGGGGGHVILLNNCALVHECVFRLFANLHAKNNLIFNQHLTTLMSFQNLFYQLSNISKMETTYFDMAGRPAYKEKRYIMMIMVNLVC